MMKGLFINHVKSSLRLATGTATAAIAAIAALFIDFVFDITGNSHYMTKQLSIALGQPLPSSPHGVYSRYEIAEMAQKKNSLKKGETVIDISKSH